MTSSETHDAEVIRAMIQHEGELLNHRITWMVTLHGLLFAALGFAWDKADAVKLIWVFGLLGALISISSFFSFRATFKAERGLVEWWDKSKKGYEGPDVIGLRASGLVSSLFYPWWMLPVTFFAAWAGILAINFNRTGAAMNWSQIVSLSASIATAVAGIAMVLTVIIYYHQLKAMTRTTRLESVLVIMKYIEDIDLRRARYFMFEYADELRHLFDAPFSWETRREIDAKVRELSGNEIGLHNIDLALNALNNVCFLVRHDYAPPEAVEAFMKNSLLHAWHAFEPYIHHRRRRSSSVGEPSQYGAHLEWVVHNKCNVKVPDNFIRRTTAPKASA